MSASRQIRFRAMNFLPRTPSIELQSIGGRPERASFRTVELRRPSEPALSPFAPLRTVLSGSEGTQGNSAKVRHMPELKPGATSSLFEKSCLPRPSNAENDTPGE